MTPIGYTMMCEQAAIVLLAFIVHPGQAAQH